MKKHNPENERIKRKYFIFIKEAKRLCEATVDTTAKSLSRFEEHTQYKNFNAFHFEQAVAFKKYLSQQKAERSGKTLSKATINSTLKSLKAFFQWLSLQPGYKSRIQYTDAEYFNLSMKDSRVAQVRKPEKAPTIEQVRYTIEKMSESTEIEKRNRALIAFTILTGMRDRATASVKLKHIDIIERCVHQDARDVKTKFSKTFSTFFFPVGDDIKEIVIDWIKYLRDEKLWGNEDPLFPTTHMSLSPSRQFEASGIKKEHWRTTTPIRKIFQDAFTAAGLPYFNPHSFRNTLVRLGQQLCRTPEEFKAWSQNLGHEKVLTTFMSYGEVGVYRQGELIHKMGDNEKDDIPDDYKKMIIEMYQRMDKEELKPLI